MKNMHNAKLDQSFKNILLSAVSIGIIYFICISFSPPKIRTSIQSSYLYSLKIQYNCMYKSINDSRMVSIK